MAVNYQSHTDWDKVKKEDKDFYHNYLPMILVGIGIGYVGEESLNEINFVSNSKKAKIKLKFSTKINLDRGLLKEIEWHKKYNIIKK